MTFKKQICGFLAALILVVGWQQPVSAQGKIAAAPPETLGTAYIVADAETGQVLIEKNADERHYPASITKIMTMGLALEKAQGALDTVVTVSQEDVTEVPDGSSYIALNEGEEVVLEDVLYATEIASANDGANVLASYVGGSILGGVDAMNRKAEELGMTNTHYVNAHGLHDPEHYTTARDMVTVTRWAMQQPQFMTVFCRSETWTMQPTNKQKERRYFSINDWMRLSGKYYRSYAKGSKSGFTQDAGNTFVTYAEQDDMRLICVVLGAPQRYDKFLDACALLDYCFGSFSRQPFGDPQYFRVPAMGGGSQLGQVTVSNEEATLLLHGNTPKEAVHVTYDIPQELVLGQPFEPKAHLTVDGTEGQTASSLTVDLKTTGLEEILKENTYVPAHSEGKKEAGVWGMVLGSAAAMVCLMMILCAHNRKSKRRRTAARRQPAQVKKRGPQSRPASRKNAKPPQRTRTSQSRTPKNPRK